MAKLRHAALGLIAGLAMSGAPERAEARNFSTTESPDPSFPFEKLAKSEDAKDIAELFHHLDDWAYRENAESVAKGIAAKRPYAVIQYSRQLLDSRIPWAQDILLIALKSDLGDNNAYRIFQNLDVNDPRVTALFEDSMEQRHPDIVSQFWNLPKGETLTERERKLLGEAMSVLPAHHPQFFIRAVHSEHERFVNIVPDAVVRKHLVDTAVAHSIMSGDPRDLKEIVAYAEVSSDIRKAIARSYGWEQFLDRCSEQIPGAVFYSLNSGNRTFLPLTFEKKRMELYRHAAERAPDALIQQWPLQESQKFLLTPSDEEEFLRLVGDSFARVIREDLEQLYIKQLTPEAMKQFPQIHSALLYVANNDPIHLLDTLSQSDPLYSASIDTEIYRKAAAESILEKRAWANDSPRDRYISRPNGSGARIKEGTRNTFEYFVGLPDEDALTEAWFRGTAIDTPQTTLPALYTQETRPQWFNDVLRTDLLYLLDERPQALDAFLTYTDRSYRGTEEHPREKLGFNDLELMLGARAQDNFAKAAETVHTLLQMNAGKNPKLPYQLLWILEQSQPYEFSAWVKDLQKSPAPKSPLTNWKSAVTAEQWNGLVAHANSIEGKKGHEKLATSTVGAGFRFTATVLEGVLGMNYTHRIHTTVSTEDPLGPIPGENFISIPMIAFETIATSDPFNAYIDAHAGERLSFVNICSVAQATWRRLRDLRLEPTPGNIERALNDVNQQWERVKNLEVFGPNTQLITFTHTEERFKNSEIIEHLLVGHGGNASQVVFQGKGADDKSAILDAIGTRRTTPITIVFSGHGGPSVIALSDLVKITPTELGDALISSNNIRNTRLIIGSCYSYDFGDKVLRYLRENGVDASGLVIMTEANQDALGFGGGKDVESRYLEAVHRQSPRTPITVETFRKAETDIWIRQDPSITIGLPPSAGWMTGIEVADSD